MDLDEGFCRTRSWRWLRTRIVGLLHVESRLQRALYPPDNGKSASKGEAEF